jgi:hypothetical protein
MGGRGLVSEEKEMTPPFASLPKPGADEASPWPLGLDPERRACAEEK